MAKPNACGTRYSNSAVGQLKAGHYYDGWLKAGGAANCVPTGLGERIFINLFNQIGSEEILRMNEDSRIVFVVGAGASVEFGLPVGSTLKQAISSSANSVEVEDFGRIVGTDRLLSDVARWISNEYPDVNVVSEMKKISAGVLLLPSIDNYLHAHSTNDCRVKLGKILIASELLAAEKASKLFFNPTNFYDRFDFSQTSDTWLAALFSALCTVGKVEDVAEKLKKITFVSFNYDRVIARFFFLAIQAAFDLSEDEADRFCAENLNILHPYGSLGELKPKAEGSGFGKREQSQDIIDAASSLRVFTEGGDEKVRSEVRKSLENSDSIFFLGFSFLKLNMDYLKPDDGVECQCFGTNLGVSEYNDNKAKNRISTWYKNGLGRLNVQSLEFDQVGCSDLINDYSGFFE
ncbi:MULTISPECIES: hypothetical protein [unclassified Ruegeria]|uniref:hypothetical protein n=1 Tax=unclassified Ruegeria TaxID=2625375 RepID=UPI001488B9B3|nr:MULTISPECIES: hypothetical protein [unclassified Ruegeria]